MNVFTGIRRAARTLMRRPGFFALALTILALGIGANAAIFSVVNGVLLRPLPVEEPERLVVPDVVAPVTGFSISTSIPNFRDWRDRSRTFEAFGLSAGRSRTLTGMDRPEVIRTRIVLGDFFEVIGARAARGRVITSEETWAGAEPIAVVSHGFWQRRLGAAEDVLGRTITLDAEPFTVVGVMPPDFRFPSADVEVWVPMGWYASRLCWDNRGCAQGSRAVGRLADGVTLGTAQSDLDRVVREIEAEEGEAVARPVLEPLAETYVGDARRQIWLLMGAVTFLLLIAGANVAGLLLAWGESRRRELAVRGALGAGAGRIARQLLTESLVLAACGGALGTAAAWLGVRAMRPALEDRVPSLLFHRIALDPTVLAFTLAVTLGVGLLFGLAPALKSRTVDLARALREGGRSGVGRRDQRLRSGLVAAQVALSVVLLVGAGLMVRSLDKLSSVDKGFDGRGVITAEVPLPAARYGEREAVWRFYERYLERVRTLPGVRSASVSNIVPLEGRSWENSVWPEGVPTEQETLSSFLFHMVDGEHFEVLGIPVLRGRTFTEADARDAPPVAVIDETMAERFWPGEDPIGKRITFESVPPEEGDGEWVRLYREVVGVVPNVRHYELESASRIQVYIPMWQSRSGYSRSMRILARTEGDPRALVDPLRRELASLDPEVPLDQVSTAEGYVDGALADTRIVGVLLGLFSVLALLLSGTGLFGIVSFSVARRVREIGIRTALGATRRDVLALVGRQGMAIAGAGAAVGLAAAAALAHTMSGLLFDVSPVEPVTYGGVLLFLLAVSALATWVPARRAARVPPATVLREE